MRVVLVGYQVDMRQLELVRRASQRGYQSHLTSAGGTPPAGSLMILIPLFKNRSEASGLSIRCTEAFRFEPRMLVVSGRSTFMRQFLESPAKTLDCERFS